MLFPKLPIKTRRSGFLRYLRINDYSLSEPPRPAFSSSASWQMRLLQSPAVQPELHPQHGDAYDPVVRVTGTCRDQTTHDNVLFQAAQFVAFARNGCFGQHASGLPERCRGDEGLGCQRRFGDTQQIAGVSCTHFAVRFQFAVCDLDARVFNLFAFQKSELPALTMVALRSI